METQQFGAANELQEVQIMFGAMCSNELRSKWIQFIGINTKFAIIILLKYLSLALLSGGWILLIIIKITVAILNVISWMDG